MKIIFSIFLTLALVSCGEIRLELGGNDVGEVGTYSWIPHPDTVVSPQDGLIRRGGYLVNTRTGDVEICISNETQVMDCFMTVSGTKTDQQMLDRNLLLQ